MSPWPHAPGSASRLTKNSPCLPTGVGQKVVRRRVDGLAQILRSSPRRAGARAGRHYVETAPSGDWIGQPSSDGVFRSALPPPSALKTLQALVSRLRSDL